MNPLKFRMPQQGQTQLDAQQPRPSELPEWLEGQSTSNSRTQMPLLLELLKKYNRRLMPADVRLKTLLLLQPAIDKVLKSLREKYRYESLPLSEKTRDHANMCLEFLDELASGYKIIITDILVDGKNKELSSQLFVTALHQAVDHLGQLLLESYSQYISLPQGLWGELHRLYYLAEQSNVQNQMLSVDDEKPNPLATIKYAYLRSVLLALTQPNHLMPGQAATIYEYLNKWTAGCRLLEKNVTIANTGDIFVDLAGERPPAIATGYTRFRPVNGRFVDITRLQTKLKEINHSLDEKQGTRIRDVTLNITERLRRDLLTRLHKAWQGRVERQTERRDDGEAQISLCVGLDAAHHFSNDEKDFNPERDETLFYRPPNKDEDIALLDSDETPWDLDGPADTTNHGLDQTRLSRFDEEEVDVWDAQHDNDFKVRDKRASAISHFQMDSWLRINQSKGGMSLRRLSETESRVRVGSLVAYLDHSSTKIWKIGVLRWLQDALGNSFDVGLMTLAQSGIPVAVRAIGGAGAGGEYFRSLLVRSALSDGKTPGLLVPASIYDTDTQLVLNLQTELKYVRLINMVETTSSFSLFEYKEIAVPPAEQVKIDALGHEEKTT